MKIMRTETLVNNGIFSKSLEYEQIEMDIKLAVHSIEYPLGSGGFYLFDKKQGNGVKPIKDLFINKLNSLGWQDEKLVTNPKIKSRRIDSSKALSDGKYFAVEWETGNISSSHRAMNRIALGMMEGVLAGGILVLPSRSMYYYLTDRVGNYQELEQYFAIWEALGNRISNGLLQVIEIEHDGVSDNIPPIPKGTDGRALI